MASACWMLLAAGIALRGQAPIVPPVQYGIGLWQQDDGLPHNNVKAILQTADGYLWVATKGGVARFDGTRFVSYSDAEPGELADNEAWALAEDGGQVWAATFGGGLSRIGHAGVRTYTTADGLASDFVGALIRAADGTLWVGTEEGLCRREGERFSCVRPEGDPRTRAVRAIQVDGSGGLWVGTRRGLYRLVEGRLAPVAGAPAILGSESILALALGRDGAVWVATSHHGIFRYDERGWSHYSAKDGLACDEVKSLHAGRDGSLWAGTVEGVSRLHPPAGDGGRFDVSRVETRGIQAAAVVDVQALGEDDEGNVWLGTGANGLARLRESPFFIHTMAHGLPDDWASSVYRDANGTIWAGTRDGLCRYTGTGFTCLRPDLGAVTAISEDARGHLWIGGPLGIKKLRGDVLESVPLRPQMGASDPPLLFRDRHRRLWLIVGDRLSSFDGHGWTDHGVIRDAAGRRGRRARAVADDASGTLWIGTREDGLFAFRDGRMTSLTKADGLPSDSVMAVLVDPDDTVWVATRSGFCRMRDGKLATLGTTDGLPANFFFHIVDDGRGYFWMASSVGLVRVSRSALNERADGGGGRISYLSFGSEGMALTGAFRAGGRTPVVRGEDGRLWFATRAGIAAVDPRRADVMPSPPRVHIEQIVSEEGRFEDFTRTVAVPPSNGRIEIHYTGLHFRAPGRVMFRYRLDGFDERWTDAGTRRIAYYTHLPPGEYHFEVAACGENGVCGAKEAAIAFTLLPRFYETAWFKLAAVAAGLLSIWGLHRLRLNFIRDRFAAILSERNRIARDLHDGLTQSLTGVSLQLDLANKGVRSLADPPAEIARRLALARDMLQFARAEARRSVADLRSQGLEAGDLMTALAALAESFRQAQDTVVEVSTHGRPHRLSAVVETNVLRICQEAVSNAVRHGGARRVTVELRFQAETLDLVVGDSGSGFDPSGVPSVAEGHFGLAGLRERVEWLGGRMRLDSAPGQGTRLEVAIPYRQATVEPLPAAAQPTRR